MQQPYMSETTMNFDTHKSIKFLIKKGIKESQAESIVEVVSQSRDHDFSKLATKDQLKLVEKDLKGEIRSVREEIRSVEERLRGEIAAVRGEIGSVEKGLRGEIAAAKVDILKWTIPLLVTILLSIVGMFFKH